MKILKFGSEDCAGCKIMKPLFEEIEKENLQLQTEYCEIDQCEEKVKKYNIEHAPTFVFVDAKGNELDRLIDVHPKEEILKRIKKYSKK